MKNKNLKYYLELNYDIVIKKIDKYDEVFYQATTKELDSLTFYGTGDTVEEAIKSLNDVKEELFPYYIEKGLEIPEPVTEERGLPSGKFLVRTSPVTHSKLLKQAKKSKQSLNAYINSIFEKACSSEDFISLLKDTVYDYIQATLPPPVTHYNINGVGFSSKEQLKGTSREDEGKKNAEAQAA